MTKFRIAGLAALALAATTLATPALASAAPEPEPAPVNSLAPVVFDDNSGFDIFGVKRINFKCSDYNEGKYPYLAFDTYTDFFQPTTYSTGDGTRIGWHLGDIVPAGDIGGVLTSTFTGASASVSYKHESVTFFCASTKQAAHQKP